MEIETRFWSIVDRDGLTGLPSDMWTALEALVARAAASTAVADTQRNLAFNAAIELAAQAAEGFDDPNRDWLRRSVWDEIKRDTAARIRKLASPTPDSHSQDHP